MIFYELRDWNHVITDYQLVLNGPDNAKIVPVVFRGLEIVVGEVQVEEIVRRSTRSRSMTPRLQDY